MQAFDESDYFVRLDPRPACESSTSAEFLSRFLKSHGIGRAALAKISAACDDSSVLQVDFQQGCHLVIPGALSFRIHIKVDPVNHLLNVCPLNDFVGKLAQSGLAFQKQDGQTKLHAEFGFESGLRLVVEKSRVHVTIGSDIDI